MAFYPRSDRPDHEDRQPRREDDDRQVRAQLSGAARINYDLTMTRLNAAPLFEESAPLNANCHWCRRILSESTRLTSDQPALPDLPEGVFSLEQWLNLVPTCVAHLERMTAHLNTLEMITYWLRAGGQTSAEIAKQHRYGYLGAFLSDLDPTNAADTADAANDDQPF